MTSRLGQFELTKLFLQSANIISDDIHTHRVRLWQNPLNNSSTRLTRFGYEFLKNTLKIEFHVCELEPGQFAHSKIYIWMDKYLQTPFWLEGTRRIVFFGTTDTVLLALYGNDLAQYLQMQAENS